MINRAATACGLRPHVETAPTSEHNVARCAPSSMPKSHSLAAAALELRPIGFVLKHSTGQELLKAIERVLHGHELSKARAES
jgi:DNA-binding NarL/FixJ family response regulator